MMNERIKKIAEEAGFIFWGNESWKPEGAVIDWASDYDQEFDKFTQLIIQECVSTCEKQVAGAVGTYAGVHNSAVCSCVKGIKDHFGVE